MICFTDAVFLADIYFNFKTAYYPSGASGGAVATDELVTDLKAIRKHYLKGAFAGDMLAAIPMGVLDILKVGYPNVLGSLPCSVGISFSPPRSSQPSHTLVSAHEGVHRSSLAEASGYCAALCTPCGMSVVLHDHARI